MTKNLRLAFLTAAMAATSMLAAAKAPAPAPQFIGTDTGTFDVDGTGDGEFYVTLDTPGQYTITGSIKTTAGSANSFNLIGVTVTSGGASDSFEHKGSDDYFENPYVITVTTPVQLLLDVNTNDKKNGAYAGTLTVTGVPLVSAVPETGTAALLLAGLGMLGIFARRRRV
jgi:hypothetical protein